MRKPWTNPFIDSDSTSHLLLLTSARIVVSVTLLVRINTIQKEKRTASSLFL